MISGPVKSISSPADYLEKARELEESPAPSLRKRRIAFAGTCTIDLLKPYMVVEGVRRGLQITPYFSSFNQLEQELLNPGSPLYEFNPDIIVIAARVEELSPRLTERFMSLAPDDLKHETDEVLQRVKNLVEQARARSQANVLVFNFAAPLHLGAGFSDPFLPASQSQVFKEMNSRLAQILRSIPDAFIFDYDRFMTEAGLDSFDPKLWYMARIPWNASTQIQLGKRLARYVLVLTRPACKCLVVDLDNTLWGGILGEEGPEGVELSEDYPGRVFKDFQRRLLALRDRGILLAVASKNNESDVKEIFGKNPDCLLKWGDFSAHQIHWEDKARSLEAIAKQLNIGLDSLAFFDDQPVEREWIRSRLPMVTVIEAPQNPLRYAKELEESGAFDQLTLSDEDLKRASLYRNENERQELKSRSSTLEEFLSQLNVIVRVGAVTDVSSLSRVAQLISKTNQFNLTTRRHSAATIQEMIDRNAVALWARVEDKYGDYGLVAAAIAVPRDNGEWWIDSFLLSCRVLGRFVETGVLKVLAEAIQKKGGRTLVGEFLPTSKNQPAAQFYSKHGFSQADAQGRLWKRPLPLNDVPLPDFIALRNEDGKN